MSEANTRSGTAQCELDDALARLDRVRVPADLFGDDEAEAVRRYRRLARLVHPDATGGRTRDAFIRLNALWRTYRRGDAAVIATRRRTYRLDGDPISGDLAELYSARSEPSGGTAPHTSRKGRAVLLKMPRDPRDGDLLEREAVALRQLPRDGDGKYLPYVPRLVESFRHRDASTGRQRQVNVIAALGSTAWPRSGGRSRTASTPATRPGCGGGCSSPSASRTARASCTARCSPTTC
ncbi:J domain-containing protein [Spirillospora sp. CA-142024]|uniref:J domain-containing protein n=1 Tax=Spirillospora sp. CA-142024 TaxID=3240036 RepID=UPI003D8AD07E